MASALRSSVRVISRLLAVGVPLSYTAYVGTSEDPVEAARLTLDIPTRAARDVYTAAAIVADYQMSLGDKQGEERKVRPARLRDR